MFIFLDVILKFMLDVKLCFFNEFFNKILGFNNAFITTYNYSDVGSNPWLGMDVCDVINLFLGF